MSLRLQRRTRAVAQAGFDPKALAAVAVQISMEEAPQLLFKAVRTCPLAGYLDAAQTQVGCLIHPARHPQGEDLRDLGAYADRTVCAGHLCAPHTWLDQTDRALLTAAPSWRSYSMAVGEAGFVKAVLRWVANARGGQVRAEQLLDPAVQDAAAAVLALFEAWPFADPDPRRFGGFSFAGDEAYERTAPSAAQHGPLLTPTEATMLDCLGSRLETHEQAVAALTHLRGCLQALADAVG